MVARLRRYFDVRAGEGQRVLFSFLYIAVVAAAFLLARPIRNALFLKQYGAYSLVYVYAAIPLVHNGQMIGGLGLSFAQPTAFGAADCAFTLLLADATAGALARAIKFDAENSHSTLAFVRHGSDFRNRPPV